MPKHATKTTFRKDKPPPPGPGRPPMEPDLKAAKALTRTEFDRLVNKYLHMSLEDLKKLQHRTDVTALEAMIVTLCGRAISGGDPVRLGFILERLIGKPREPRRSLDLRIGKIPAHTELLSQTARIAYLELQKLEDKAANEGLNSDDHRALATLSANLLELKAKLDNSPESEELRNMTDDDLLKHGEEAVLGLRKLITSGGEGA